MNNRNLKELFDLVTEEQTDSVEAGLFLKLTNRDNVLTALGTLLDSGFSVDVNMSMGEYFFNFKTAEAAIQARAIVNSVIDKSKEV